MYFASAIDQKGQFCNVKNTSLFPTNCNTGKRFGICHIQFYLLHFLDLQNSYERTQVTAYLQHICRLREELWPLLPPRELELELPEKICRLWGTPRRI
uniref:Uncharacterized protein n=1 Tax=Setaria italica TaxID=4555 RepID=K3YB51_SETIT